MKAVKRGAGAGNKNPVKRQGFPDCDQDKLDEAIDCYIRSMGVAASFDLLEYKNLQAQQAEQPKAVYKLHKLVESLLKVSPSGQIKYGQLRQALQVACNRFGVELLSPHWPVEKAHLAGRAADALGVLLKHWRRLTASQTAWEKFGRKLEESHFNQLQSLYKMMKPGGCEKAKRELTAHMSEVTVDSSGLPAMLKTTSEEGDESSPSCPECDSKNSLFASPPPAGKHLWRAKAGKPVKKRPAKKTSPMKTSPMKAAHMKAAAMKAPTKGKQKNAGLAGGATTKIHTATLSVGGGKNQSYIQHVPGPGNAKRLIVACTGKQAASLKVSHKAIIEELLPKCKVPNTTKGDILKARDGLFKKYEK